MNETMLVALVFAVLLGLEWRYRLRSMRVGVASLALIVLWFAQPLPHRAARRAFSAPPAERVTELRGSPLSEYMSGVLTMEQAVAEDARMDAGARLLCVGVLFWLACSPALRRARPSLAAEPAPSRAAGQG